MARREALRALQARLAERLQAARGQSGQSGWLAVECGGQGLLFPLASAGEIFALGPLVPLPHTQPWFSGVANLRGVLHGVVDLGAFLGLREPLAGEALRDPARLVSLNAATGSHAAVLVDRLAGLRSAEQLVPLPPEDDGARPPFAAGRHADAEGRAWQAIDLMLLARDEQFLGIARHDTPPAHA
jgi:twitching motility protein PilI